MAVGMGNSAFVQHIHNYYRQQFSCYFKSGLLNERKVSYEYVESDGKSRCILFNFEAILFVSYRINTLETRAFREWALKSVSEYTRNNKNSKRNIVINYNMGNRSSTIYYN